MTAARNGRSIAPITGGGGRPIPCPGRLAGAKGHEVHGVGRSADGFGQACAGVLSGALRAA